MAASSSEDALSQQAMEFLYHHVFLPPEVPQSDDFNPDLDLLLMQVVRDGLAELKDRVESAQRGAVAAAIGMLDNMQSIQRSGEIEARQLMKSFRSILGDGPPIALHVRAQNAGIFIRNTGGEVHLSVFELLPLNEAAMATKGRLCRSFPAAAVSMPRNEFERSDLQRTLAETLSTMSSRAVAGMQPKASKAGQWHDEDRDTTHPGMVTEVLMGFLSAIGRPVEPATVTKNTREEVRWNKVRSPWRRSATWLLIRVALRLILSPSQDINTLYKEALLLIMCRIERHALTCSFHSDGLYIMNAKVARRVLKLGDNIDDAVSTRVGEVTCGVQEELKLRWRAIQAQNSRKQDLSALMNLDFQRDTSVSLPGLDAHIIALAQQKSVQQTTKAVKSPALLKFTPEELPSLSTNDFSSSNAYALANLHTFEAWVASYSWTWAGSRTASSYLRSTRDVAALIKNYHALATRYYSENPEALSNMTLTIFELWIACDRIVTLAIPLLKDYDPGINDDILQNLLLPLKTQMERLVKIEGYLRKRSSNASNTYSELFVSVGTSNCFAVRYFDGCEQQQTVLQQILDEAERAREAKVEELHTKQQEYDRLMDQHARAECEDETYTVRKGRNRFSQTRHSRNCMKCSYQRQATSIQIAVHEWPLPSNKLKAKSVVFELRIPALFASWRDATVHFVKDILQTGPFGRIHLRAQYKLDSDKHLHKYLESPATTNRCTLLSEDKPHIGTHRKIKSAAMASESDVCLNNGLNYKYYDTAISAFMGTFIYTDDAARAFTYSIPSCSKSLQEYIFRPASAQDGPPPNKIIAEHADCPSHMSLEEYKELGNLCLGHRIQWYNLLLQLRAPTIDFRKDETALVIFQCIYQTGPRQDGEDCLRASHRPLDDESLAQQLVDSINVALGRVKENWESAQSLCIFSAVIRRLLSLSRTSSTKYRCQELLKTIRNVSFGWLTHLRDRTQKAESHSERNSLRSKCVEVALISALTFDVDDSMLGEMFSSAKNTSILIQCSIVIQEAKRTFIRSSEPVAAILDHQFRKLMRRSCKMLCTSSKGLDDAIKQAWPAFRPSNNWTAMEGREDHWVRAISAVSGFTDALAVYYNALTGELLVNGLPLDRPPKKYEDHTDWPVLFGRSAIEVMPTIAPGMQLSLKQMYQDHEVHVGMNISSGGGELVVRASADGNTYTTVPARLLEGQFPTYFVKSFVHWYNHKDRTLEFRPLSEPWANKSAKIWTLEKLESNNKWQLARDHYAVIATKSDTTTEIGAVLRPLVQPDSVHMIVNPLKTSVEVEVPTLQLGFSLHSGTSLLLSREFRGMSISEDQTLQTLIGLDSKLLLSSRTSGDGMVLLAEGPVNCVQSEGHVKATINRSSILKVHPLSIDSLLGRLVDNGDLQSKLFIAYLHALTSFCLPDPLTGKTGTEECLSLLQGAAVQSFDQLSSRNADTLREIASLAPSRAFYPANEKVMQTVTVSSKVGALAQHNGLFKAARAVLFRAEKYVLFYADTENIDYSLACNDEHLLERDCIRAASFRVSGFGAEDFSFAEDAMYQARDGDQTSNRSQNAYNLSSIVYGHLSSRHWGKAMPNNNLWTAAEKARSIIGVKGAAECIFNFDPRLVASGLDMTKWLALHQIAKPGSRNRPSKFDLMMWLATLASFKGSDMAILQTIALMYTTASVRDESIPTTATCDLSEGTSVTKGQIQAVVQSCYVDVGASPEGDLEAKDDEDLDSFISRRDSMFSKHQRVCTEALVSRISRQWPSSELEEVDFADQQYQPSDYINVSAVMSTLRPKFKMCFDNLQLFKYFTRVQSAVDRLPSRLIPTPTWLEGHSITPAVHQRAVLLDDILAMNAPMPSKPTNGVLDAQPTQTTIEQFPQLSNLIKDLERMPGSAFEKAYVQELEESFQCLIQKSHQHAADLEMVRKLTLEALQDHRVKCQNHLDGVYNLILTHVEQCSHDISGAMLSHRLTHWPRISPTLLLRLLNRHYWPKLRHDWKGCVVEFGLAITAVQRANRLLKAAKSSNVEDLTAEVATVGHSNWDPFEHPESLLLEIESGILVRDVQEEIAAEMRNPPSSRNAVMQLNMGEGKSSVIVPMVATSLADTSQLVRVIVAKPQSKQMWQMLVSKLGGLIDRRVRLMPFSRSLKLNVADAAAVGGLVKTCMARGDVLLVQPEHLLSFQLMVLECYDTAAKQQVGKSLLETQLFFDKFSRDVVDESDENFSTKFELIYTMGTQRQIEFSPNRWICIQQVLGLVQRFGHQLARQYPGGVEIGTDDHGPGSFHRLRILDAEAGDFLVNLVASHICHTGIDGFPVMRQGQSTREAVRTYLTKFELSEDEIGDVESADAGSLWNSALARSTLLLLRGLLAGGILAFVFGNKRWRVNYGLVSDREPPTRLAVPYRAKDNPTPRSEFSHPDVVLALTSLSYYYEGLTNEDLFTALKHLMRSDQADVEYGAWVADARNLPSEFCNIEGINLKDTIQCTMDIFPHLRFGKAVIDYFLANIVFPQAMKEFPYKLSASGWDLGKLKARPTTGFSGTNDSKTLLPLDVTHLDLDRQRHTNALVLNHILGPGNSVLMMRNTTRKTGSDAERLLTAVIHQTPSVQVILDVGAQILELDNFGLARRWLEMHPDAGRQIQAVVFVNNDDELSVFDLRGRVERLQTSSYASRLDECLVFLDEAHTRGIDLKLPKHYRAAVTLGADLTKDRLVQACMRMRKLGKGQTVLFCVNEEIEDKIRAQVAKSPLSSIELPDILKWTISETFKETKRSMPLWAVQGERFLKQNRLWDSIDAAGPMSMSKAKSDPFLEPEAQTLDDRYRPKGFVDVVAQMSLSSVDRMEEIQERCSRFNDLQFRGGTLQEEQERELSPEIEQERQTERRTKATPSSHSLHQDVTLFVSSGKIQRMSSAYMPAFRALQTTTAAVNFKVSQLDGDGHLLASTDFAKAIERSNSYYTSDSFQRAVQWILVTKPGTAETAILMIISAYEAEQLMPTIRASSKVALHLYKPRCVIGHCSFDKLDFMSIPARATTEHVPRSLLLQLAVFSGQLYLSSYEDYLEVCAFLGLAATAPLNGEIVAADGFIIKDSLGKRPGSSPVSFLSALMAQIRRNGQGISKTDMGFILDGKILERSHFEGRVVDEA